MFNGNWTSTVFNDQRLTPIHRDVYKSGSVRGPGNETGREVWRTVRSATRTVLVRDTSIRMYAEDMKTNDEVRTLLPGCQANGSLSRQCFSHHGFGQGQYLNRVQINW